MTMQAKDLMIGDWVNYHDDDKIVPKQVSEITNYKQLQLNDKNNWIIVGEKYCEPIPLTWDILYKNFPDTDDGLAWWENTEFENDAKDEYLWWHITVTGDVLVVDGEIRYVHELQHALRLCGIEKEIEL